MEKIPQQNSKIEEGININEVKKRISDLEMEYPKLFGKHPVEDARYGLEQALTSEWIDDEIEIVQNGEYLVLKNLSQIEEMDNRIQNFKSKVADFAFKLLKLREDDNLTPGKEDQILLGNIKGYKEQIDDLNKKIDSYNIKMPANPEGYNNPDKNTWLLHSAQFLKPEYIYGKRMSMKNMISELYDQYFKTGLDEKTEKELREEYSDLQKILADDYFDKID